MISPAFVHRRPVLRARYDGHFFQVFFARISNRVSYVGHHLTPLDIRNSRRTFDGAEIALRSVG